MRYGRLGVEGRKWMNIVRIMQQLVDKNPFRGMEHSQTSSLHVTFLKKKRKIDIRVSYNVDNRDDTLMGIYDSAICSVIDLTSARTPDLMLQLEKKFGKEITTRTFRESLKEWAKSIFATENTEFIEKNL